MSKSSARSVIRLRGVRHNNLKNFDLDLPLNQLIVITGLSGSGKSSLAFDTLFAEGQRRYIETFSPYARQFLDRMDKPQVDSIEGIPPAIAIEQRNSVRTTRSTVGTMTEICDYMKMLWPQVAQLHCRQCGQPVRKEPPQWIWEALTREARTAPRAVKGNGAGSEVLLTFDLPLTEKLSLDESLALVAKQGYQRLLVGGQILRLEEAASHLTLHAPRSTPPARLPPHLTVIQDRLPLTSATRARFVEACEQAYHFGKGKLTVWEFHPPSSIRNPRRFSAGLHCATCDLEYHEPTPALFSFNHPVGACPACRGFGRIISIDYDLALPDHSKTLAEGVVKPWLSGMSAECQTDLLRTCRRSGIPTDVPFAKLPKKWQKLVVEGDPNYGKDEAHKWPRAWYGVKGYFRWLESKSYKMHVRVLLSRYRAYTPCPACQGKRFQPESLLYHAPGPAAPKRSEGRSTLHAPNGLTLADFYQLPIRDAVPFIEALAGRHRVGPNDPLALALHEVRSRLGYLNEVGLGYLTLDRPTRSLSGGETERVSLTTCLGTRLVNTLFVLDEPSVGLHPRDTERLVRILEQLRDAGNTVVVVEHEASVMRSANQLLDLGPGHGATGGQIVFQGTYPDLLECGDSLTGQYLSGQMQIEVPQRRAVTTGSASRRSGMSSVQSSRLNTLALNEAEVPYRVTLAACPTLKIAHATKHNLNDLAVEIPLGRFVCVTGVSGSGKSTLVRDVLLPALTARLKSDSSSTKASDRLDTEAGDEGPDNDSASAPQPSTLLTGSESVGQVVLVDQSILAKTPRSNPAVYIGAFEDIREFFAQSDLAKQRGLNASAFSFNSTQGQCERCRGAGFEKIEMQFLSDVFIRCPDCNGRRYRSHILDVKVSPKFQVSSLKPQVQGPGETEVDVHAPRSTLHAPLSLSIADLLESTVEEAIAFLTSFPDSRPAQRAAQSLTLLEEVGLGYLKLGQPINTLSGGESQRLKLVRHLAEATDVTRPNSTHPIVAADVRRRNLEFREGEQQSLLTPATTLFLFDEPTTGLHFDDVRVLLKVFQRLVNAGHSVLVIEHNLDVIKSADWIIDLGPDAGDQGGQVVAHGTPERVMQCAQSHTGRALRQVLTPQAATREAECKNG
ncbi:MAG TPA: excinuclease ABC subunit UvrA [Candidatus Acidoferrum sp.]|jgi:excinuclease ABC subunit A|nr:excinuclease ABC subunit UvrA [Candidatus Acidoferrum sp.]